MSCRRIVIRGRCTNTAALALVALLLFSSAGCIRYECDSAVAFGNLGPAINSPYDDYAPALADTATLAFTSNRVVPGRGGLNEHARQIRPTYLFSSMRLTSSWDLAQPYPLIIGQEDIAAGTIAFAPAGSPYDIVAYVSACGDAPGGCDLFAVTSRGRGALVNLGPDINTPTWEGQPFVTRDGAILYFASERPGGFGGSDIWFSRRTSTGAWGPPENAGPRINTAADEFSPFVSIDGRLFFAGAVSERGREIFVLDTPDAERRALPSPYNSEADDFTPFIVGDRIYLASNRAGGCGGYDLYSFQAP